VPLHVFYPFTPESVKTSRETAAALERAESSLSSADLSVSTSSPATTTTAPMQHPPLASRPAVFRMGDRYDVPIAHDESNHSTATNATQPSDPRATADQTAPLPPPPPPPELPSPSWTQRQPHTTRKAGATFKAKVVDLSPGAGRFIGLWALANHALEYPFLGPMFENKSDQNE